MAVNRLKLSFNAYEHNLLLLNMSYNATIYMTLDTITLFYCFILITNYELPIMYKTLLCTYVFRGTIILRNVL